MGVVAQATLQQPRRQRKPPLCLSDLVLRHVQQPDGRPQAAFVDVGVRLGSEMRDGHDVVRRKKWTPRRGAGGDGGRPRRHEDEAVRRHEDEAARRH